MTLSLLKSVAAQARFLLFRAFGGAAARLEPRHDPGHMAQQFERGELVWRAFVDAGVALRRAGRFDEADTMIARGLAVFPADRALLYEHAFSAHVAGRYAVAVARWEAALAAAPDLAMCHAGVAANLRESGAIERAATIIAAALRRFPDDLTVATEAARIADARLRFEESLPLWRRAAESANPAPEWLQGEAHALLRLARFDEAQRILDRARPRFPDAPGLMAIDALLASERGDRRKAVALWSGYTRRFPADANGREQLERARERQSAALPAAAVDRSEPRNLLLGFESLGDGCEFGEVQRRHGAEPDGLLRWNEVAFDGLLSALGARFAGLGEPANTSLAVTPARELMIEDRRWGLGRRTFLYDGEEDHGALLERMCGHIAIMRDKLLVDLAAADKIFVFRSSGLDADRLAALHGALRAFGPVRLLDVQPAAPTAPTSFQGAAGELIEVGEGRYVGFLERLGVETSGVWDAAYEDWLSICSKAARLSA